MYPISKPNIAKKSKKNTPSAIPKPNAIFAKVLAVFGQFYPKAMDMYVQIAAARPNGMQ